MRLSLLACSTEVNDVFFYLGTKNGKRPFINPVLDHMIILEASSISDKSPLHSLVDKETQKKALLNFYEKPFATKNEPNSFIIFDFLVIAIKPKKYFIRSTSLLNWVLQGSNDKIQWETIRDHQRDISFLEEQCANWELFCSKYYRYLRILQSGLNHKGNHTLSLFHCSFDGKIYAFKE